MRTCLYIGVYEGRDTYIKPGIFTDGDGRLQSYGKGGNLMTIHRLLVCKNGLENWIMSLEQEGKNHFLPYRMKFNGINETEYLQFKTAPNGYPILTLDKVIDWYYKRTEGFKGLFWVKEEFLPITSEEDSINDLLQKISKNPHKYLDIK